MKKPFLLLLCLTVFTINMCGCQKASTEKNEEITNIAIGYGFKSYVAMISDKDEIKQLEELFNGAEFVKSDTSIQQPYLSIAFYRKNSITPFYIDDKDVIQLSDGSYMKSEQITFQQLYSVYNEYLSEKK